MSDSYPLKPFRIRSQQLIVRVINEYPLATVISGDKKNREITLLPLMLKSSEDGCLRLIGHLDRNNPHTRLLVSGAPVSVVFQGPRHANLASRFLAGTQNPSPQPLFTEILEEMTANL